MLSAMRFTAGILAAILVDIWFLAPRLPGRFVIVPATIVLALALVHAARAREWGFAPRALVPALRASTLFTLPFLVGFLAAGALLHTTQHGRGSLGELGSLVVWGGAQQWVLQTTVLREAQRATSRRAGVLVAAALFAAVHLPNPFLAGVTFAGALGWCAIYDRHPNVLPLALSHALATLVILYAFDDGITGRLRIGMAYLAR
jgi:membrane protease YdiL (CAAX protease family)